MRQKMAADAMNAELFWTKVDKQEECWPWTGKHSTGGYGVFHVKVSGRWTWRQAHRLTYEQLVGAIPDGKQLDHICHNRSCVNPDHLRPVTQKQNMEHLRGGNVGSASGIRGVTQEKRTGRWRASIGHDGKHLYIGTFDTPEEAGEAARAKRNELFTHNDEPPVVDFAGYTKRVHKTRNGAK